MKNEKNALVINHVPYENLGTLEDILVGNNYNIKFVEASLQLDNLDILEPDLIVILGGPIGVYEEENYPFLKTELDLIDKRIKADLPTIGICLGCQLIARVLGANVYPDGNGKEIGWSNISLSDAGVNSPLANLKNTPVLHWHGDTFDLPESAIHLASSSKYQNQAFSYGKNVLALQFHPEVTAKGLERWFIGHACEISTTEGISVPQLREDTAKYALDLQQKAKKLWQELLDTFS